MLVAKRFVSVVCAFGDDPCDVSPREGFSDICAHRLPSRPEPLSFVSLVPVPGTAFHPGAYTRMPQGSRAPPLPRFTRPVTSCVLVFVCLLNFLLKNKFTRPFRTVQFSGIWCVHNVHDRHLPRASPSFSELSHHTRDTPTKQSPPTPSPLHPLVTANLLSVSMDLPFLDSSHKKNLATCGLL